MTMKRQKSILVAFGMTLLLASCSNSVPDTSPEWDLQTVPQQVTWIPGPAGLEYPISEISGPSTASPVPHGWSADPQGAVLAAMTSQIFLSGADDTLWPTMAQTLVEPGPGRDQWAQARALVSVEGTLDQAPVMQGFQVNEFSETDALVTVAARWPDGTMAGLPVQLSRSQGDWRVVLPTQDQAPDLTLLNGAQLADFTTFTPDEENVR